MREQSAPWVGEWEVRGLQVLWSVPPGIAWSKQGQHVLLSWMCITLCHCAPNVPRTAGCTFRHGSVVRCVTTGETYFIDYGKLRQYPNSYVYDSYGNPPVEFTDFGGCTKVLACPLGDPMPFKQGKPPPALAAASVCMPPLLRSLTSSACPRLSSCDPAFCRTNPLLLSNTPLLAAPCGDCVNTPGGTRVLPSAGSTIYKEPCSTSPPTGTLQQCEQFTYTGVKKASACGGRTVCYAQLQRGGQLHWVPSHVCGSPSGSTISDTACPRECAPLQFTECPTE